MLPSAVTQLMPTPAVADGTGGHTSRSGARKGELMLPGLVKSLPAPVDDSTLLPTPAINDMGAGKDPEKFTEWRHRQKSSAGTKAVHGRSLDVEARLLPTPQLSDTNGASEKPGEWEGRFQLRDIILPRVAEETGILLPTPVVTDVKASGAPEGQDYRGVSLTDATVRRAEAFGQYAPAIVRWETVIEREAPSPVEPTGRDGSNRLSPRFVEWMMGLPDGWVTDTPGVTRNEALSLGGDGVVPQQCAAAVSHLIAVRALYANQPQKVTA